MKITVLPSGTKRVHLKPIDELAELNRERGIPDPYGEARALHRQHSENCTYFSLNVQPGERMPRIRLPSLAYPNNFRNQSVSEISKMSVIR